MKQPVSRNCRGGESEGGFVLLFGIFAIFGILVVAALLIDIGVAELRTRELQSQIDGASLAGASILDLRQTNGEDYFEFEKLRSFRFAKEAAWKYLHLAGIVETETPPSDGCDQDAPVVTPLDQEGWQCTKWIIGARTITIERGLYYQDTDENHQFVSLEGVASENACEVPLGNNKYIYNIFGARCISGAFVPGEINDGEEAFWFTNAVKIIVTDNTVRGFFSVGGLFGRAEFSLASRDTVSSRGVPNTGTPNPW